MYTRRDDDDGGCSWIIRGARAHGSIRSAINDKSTGGLI